MTPQETLEQRIDEFCEAISDFHTNIRKMKRDADHLQHEIDAIRRAYYQQSVSPVIVQEASNDYGIGI